MAVDKEDVLRPVLLASVALLAMPSVLAAAPSGAPATPPGMVAAEDVPLDSGGVVRFAPMARSLGWQREILMDAVIYDVDPTPLSPQLCPTGRVMVETKPDGALRDIFRRSGGDRATKLGGLFLAARGSSADCRILLSIPSLRRMDDARVCNLMQHELGHARGLAHTPTGRMAPVLNALPVDECDWAWSDLWDGDAR